MMHKIVERGLFGGCGKNVRKNIQPTVRERERERERENLHTLLEGANSSGFMYTDIVKQQRRYASKQPPTGVV
jgi:hypothetical protein